MTTSIETSGAQDSPVDAASAKTLDAPTRAGHGVVVAEREPRGGSRRGGVVPALMFVVLILGLIAATLACSAVIGLLLALWPPAVIDAMAEGALRARAGVLGGALAAPLVVAGLLHLSWRSFAKARTGRCADFMILALAGASALCWVLAGWPSLLG